MPSIKLTVDKRVKYGIMLFVFLLLFWAAGTKGPWKVSFFPFNMTVEGGLPRPTGGNNVSDQYHSDRSLYENSDYPPRRHPSREAEHTHGGRRAALRQSHARRPRRGRREHGRLSFIDRKSVV